MVANDGFYSEENHGPFERFALGRFELEEGGALEDAFVAYTTFGTLSAARDNVILVPTWYSGTQAIMSQVYIGEGHALDPSKYFVVVVNQLGSGLSTSPHHGLGGDFPRVRIGDDVVAQERLLRERFGVEELALVVGGSMGGQQSYEWAVRFPDRVRRAAPLAATARIPDLNAIFVDVICHALDGAGDGVAAGLAHHARAVATMGFSTEFWAREVWRTLGFDSAASFVAGFLVPYFAPMDRDNLLCQAWKWQHADVGRHAGGDLAAALGRITATTFVMPIDTDLFFPLEDCRREQELVAGSELRPIRSVSGHLALFGFEPDFVPQVDGHLRELLARG
jgi:homoserine O-acetyltransferase/O-succinyltransferase